MTNFELTLRQIAGKPITIDCNVLLLLIVGSVDTSYISTFKRTDMFDEDDYFLLIKLIRGSSIILTPNILTEASNLLETLNKKLESKLLIQLREVISQITEKTFSSAHLSNSDIFLKLGLSDSSIIALALAGVIPITIDFDLVGQLLSKRCSVINFHHVRSDYIS